MKLGGRIQAAIEVLEEIENRHRPAAQALRDWGTSHRFAGSGDRNAIGNLVYDALRKRRSAGYLMQDDKPVAAVFLTVTRDWGVSPQQMQEAFDGDRHAPEIPFAKLEAAKSRDFAFAEPDIEADVPAWCVEQLEEGFNEDWVEEAKALAERPPLDLRVNTLKADRAKVEKALSATGCRKTAISLSGLRIASGSGARRLPNVQAEPAFQKGWFEIQDEGSQIVSELVFARPGEQILDYCAGAGGKTLAMAAMMDNKGQIHAHDADKNRLAPIFDRMKRAGVRNSQVHADSSSMQPLEAKMDRVLVDAPCTGSGVWRRRPDAKWRLTPEQLEQRLAEQKNILDSAAQFVRPGGFLCYVTCSVFPAENEEQVYAFGERHPGWSLLSAGEVWQDLYGFDKLQPWSADLNCITLTPASTDTDGFFFSVMQRDAP